MLIIGDDMTSDDAQDDDSFWPEEAVVLHCRSQSYHFQVSESVVNMAIITLLLCMVMKRR